MALIPIWGATGAAWSSVITFAAFSGIGLLRYRRIDRYPYPLFKCSTVLLGMIATYAAFQWLNHLSQFWLLTIAAVVWTVWAVALFGRLGVQFAGGLFSRKPDAGDGSAAAAEADSSRDPVSHHA